MRCLSCGGENRPDAKFCKHCGKDMSVSFKRCANGHNFPANLDDCPFCPKTGSHRAAEWNHSGDAEASTLRGVSDDGMQVPDSGYIATVLDAPPPVKVPGKMPPQPSVQSEEGKTVIMSPAEKPIAPAHRKLVGWLVTFDIVPEGTDFRLYEGRMRIGSRAQSDIILNYPGISDDHALFLYRNGKYLLKDELSTNGTFVNGVMIEESVELHPDDIITIGNLKLKFKTV